MNWKLFSKSNLKKMLLGVVLVSLTACQRIYITTNSFADTEAIPCGFPKGSSFSIGFVYTNNELISNDIAEMISKEVNRKITKILQDQGLVITKDAASADYNLIFSFGMTSFTSTVSVPVYIPGQAQYTNGSVYGNGGYVQYNQQTQSSGSFIYVPKQCTYFNRSLVIQVYDARLFRENEQQKQLWNGLAISTGESCDIRDIIDYLLVTAFKHFGKSTQKNIETSMYRENKEVSKLKKHVI